ncbi:MAG: polysaccharide pyruvyl transferase family protein [Firmicutes bacterium]|nr:polysaccharide pyruvyl transferase family protein [Bacillota bacterium]
MKAPTINPQTVAPKDLWDNFYCPGCAACANVCPTNALTMSPNQEGYYRPKLDEQKCVNCNKCVKTCPVYYPVKNDENFQNAQNPACYEFIAKDENLLHASSSGGAFGLMAKWILSQKGVVCGVAWNEQNNFSVQHILIDKLEDLPLLQKSKYLQSEVGLIHRQIKEKLDADIPVLFSGSPCHVAGLYNYLKNASNGKLYKNLYTVDLLCAQAPSTKYFQKYLTESFNLNDEKNKNGKLIKYTFRSKKDGWNHDALLLLLLLPDGSTKEVHKRLRDDDWQRLYHDSYMKPNHCAWCQFSVKPRLADITIGDFWGLEKRKPNPLHKKGTSVVLVNNEKGQAIFNAIKQETQLLNEHPLEWVGGNGSIFTQRAGQLHDLHKRTDFNMLVENLPFSKVVDSVRRERFDVGIVGWWYGHNYGSILTNFALYKVITNLGYSALMIRKSEVSPTNVNEHHNNHAYNFAKNHYIIAKKRDFREMYDLNNLCDTFVVGSDQLWHDKHFLDSNDYYLGFADATKKKIAYATSFGPAEKWVPPSRTLAKRGWLLSQFDYISVREKTGTKHIKHYGVTAEHVLDPVFMISAEEYSKLQEGATISSKDDFLTAYILDPSPAKREQVVAIAKKLNLKIIVITDASQADIRIENAIKIFYKERVITDVRVENFVYLFCNAKYVVTDSFHGVCFSYIFRKDFNCFYNHHRGVARFESIINTFGLHDRRIYEDKPIEDSQIQPIDYSTAEKEINRMYEFSLNWLKKAIETPKQFKPNPYDVVKRDIHAIDKRLENALNEIAELKQIIEEQNTKANLAALEPPQYQAAEPEPAELAPPQSAISRTMEYYGKFGLRATLRKIMGTLTNNG